MDGAILSARYVPPTVEDYGGLAELTASQVFLAGFDAPMGVAAMSMPLPPGSQGGPDIGGGGPDGGVTGTDLGDAGFTGGGEGGGTAGGGAGTPSGAGNGGAGGGAGGELPFTGFPAAAAALIGSAAVGTGAALRQVLRRR